MITKTKKRTKKYRNNTTWKNVSLTERGGNNGGLFGNAKKDLIEQEMANQVTQKKLQDALKGGFLEAMQDVHADPSLDVHDFIEACEHAIAELKATAANMARKPGEPVVPPTDEPETVAVSSDDFPSKSKAFAESLMQPEPRPRYLSLTEYDRRQKQAFKQLS